MFRAMMGGVGVVALLATGPAMAQMVTPGVGVGIPNGLSGPGGTMTFTPAPVVGADIPNVGVGVGRGIGTGRVRHHLRSHTIVRRGPGVLSDQRR